MIRSLAEAVPFEFGVHRERDLLTSEILQSAVSIAGSLLLSIVTFPYGADQDQSDIQLPEFRVSLGHALRNLAARLDQNSNCAQSFSRPLAMSLDGFRASATEHAKNTLTVFKELETECRRVLPIPQPQPSAFDGQLLIQTAGSKR